MFGPPNVQKLLEKRNVAGLARALKHRDSGIRAEAAEALLGVLAGDDPKERATAAGALADAGDERAVEPLIAALGDED